MATTTDAIYFIYWRCFLSSSFVKTHGHVAQLGEINYGEPSHTLSLLVYIFVKLFAERYKTESRDRGGEIALMLMVVMKMVSMVSSAFPLSNIHVTYWSLASCPCFCGAVLNHFPSDTAIARFADHFNHLLVIIMLYYRQQ